PRTSPARTGGVAMPPSCSSSSTARQPPRLIPEPADMPVTGSARDAATVPEILFICVHNAGRSIAAAVLTEHYAKGRVRVRSAGSEPGSEVNPAVAQVLRERGLDPDRHFPKPLTDAAARTADVIVSMGCGDA